MNEAVQPKWYDNKFAIVAFLIIFFPIGLYFLWRSTTFSKTNKSVLSIVIAAFIIALSQIESPQTDHTPTITNSTVSQSQNSVIQASLNGFKSEIPLLNKLSLLTLEFEGRNEYYLKNFSTMGQKNWVFFYDSKKNGTIDQVFLILMFDKNNEAKIMESLGLGYRLIEVASGKTGFMDEYLQWIHTKVLISPDTLSEKWFGPVFVESNFLSDGKAFSLRIGADNVTKR